MLTRRWPNCTRCTTGRSSGWPSCWSGIAVTAEDVVQDAFVAMRAAWPRLGDTEKALAYLRQAVVNRSRSVLRHWTVAGKNLPQALPDIPGAEHGALDLLDQPAAMAALLGLPERQREAIVLRFYADLSEDQIAATMHISRGAVRSHTARGLSGLRAALDQASGPVTNDTIRGSSDRSILILTSLADGPKHGYALIKDIDGFAAVKLGPGTLYGALAKLEAGRPGRGAAPAGPQAPVPDHRGRPGVPVRAADRVSPHRRDRIAAHRVGVVMNRHLLRVLLALYPRAWRDRYGAELAGLTEDLISAGEITTAVSCGQPGGRRGPGVGARDGRLPVRRRRGCRGGPGRGYRVRRAASAAADEHRTGCAPAISADCAGINQQ